MTRAAFRSAPWRAGRSWPGRVALLGALLLGAAGCIPEEGPMMEPGSDCMECHDGGEAPRWTVAGTWGGRGNQVRIQDAAGKSFTLHTNQAGNLWSAEPVTLPLRVWVNGEAMPGTATTGSCNASACHPPSRPACN